MHIGKWDVHALETGRFALDGGAMFGVVPRTLWSKSNPPDERNRIPMVARAMLLRSKDRVILVDNGNGDKWDEKMRAIYDVGDYLMEQSLASFGLTPADITDVLLTHLHFDHAGGSTKVENGNLVPRFPNARYAVQRENLQWARNATEKDRASYLKENFEPLIADGMLDTLDGPGEFAPGVHVLIHSGHTTSMQLVQVRGNEGTVVFCADLIPTASHVHVPYVMAYDNFPLTTLEEKKDLLARASTEGWILVFEHDPDIPAATVVHGPKGYALHEHIAL